MFFDNDRLETTNAGKIAVCSENIKNMTASVIQNVLMHEVLHVLLNALIDDCYIEKDGKNKYLQRKRKTDSSK